MNASAYTPRFSDVACRGALVALADAVEQRIVADLPPLTPEESRRVFYAGLGYTPEQVAAGFAAADRAWRENAHVAAKGNTSTLVGAFFVAARKAT